MSSENIPPFWIQRYFIDSLVCYVSPQSHYSIKKAGAALGFGTDNVILLSTDERFVIIAEIIWWILYVQHVDPQRFHAALLVFRGRVIPADLEAKILDAKQKVRVFFPLLFFNIIAPPCTFISNHISFHLSWVLHLQGYVPLFVNATAGSTVYGAFDPINEIADICEKYNLWLHVDVSSLQ